MRFLVFDIKGKFAHFRKFYTNSSSLSYLAPPRTTIEGIIAAIIGLERDTYYDVLSADKLMVALQKMEKTYKVVQTLNYIKAETSAKLVRPAEHTQIPIEILTSHQNCVKFRVFAAYKGEEEIYERLKNNLKSGQSHFPIYLGCAPFLAMIEYIGEFEGKPTEEKEVPISTLIDVEKIGLIRFSKGIYSEHDRSKPLALVKDKMPYDFDSNRYAKQIRTYIHDENLQPIVVELNGDFMQEIFYIKDLEEKIGGYISLM